MNAGGGVSWEARVSVRWGRAGCGGGSWAPVSRWQGGAVSAHLVSQTRILTQDRGEVNKEKLTCDITAEG